MRNDFLTVWQFNGLLMAVLASISISTSCSNEMSSTYTSSVSPTPVGAKVLAAELPKCKGDVRPIRVAFIVDNTGSNAASPDDIQKGPNFVGTDPLKSFVNRTSLLSDQDLKGFSKETVYTDRQVAVYKAILKLQKASAAARLKNASFQGIDVGVAHFPYAPPNLKLEDPVDVDDLKKAVFHNGADKGLSDAMTDVSKISFSEAWSKQVWNMLGFTHYSRGMTPYVTAFQAANELLVSEKNKKAGDTRPGLVILVTDGLPTDPKPSDIIAARSALGKDTRVALLSVYQANEDDEAQNAPAKSALKSIFESDGWGKEEHQTFDSYWNALRKIPQSNEVRDDYFQVKVTKLQESLDQLLDRYIKCSLK